MICTRCGAAQPDQTMFCGQCGNKLDAAGAGQPGMDATQTILPASAGRPLPGEQRPSPGEQPPPYGYRQQPAGSQPPPNPSQPPANGYRSQPPSNGNQQPFGYQAQPNGNQAPSYQSQPPSNGDQQPWGNQPSYGNQPGASGYQAPSYGNQPAPNGYQPPSYGNQAPPYLGQPGSSGNQQPWGNQPSYGNQPPPFGNQAPYGYQQPPAAPAARPGRGRRTAVIAAVTAVLVLTVLGVAGWQAHWPPGVFGSKAAPTLAWSASKAPLPADAAGGSDQSAVLNAVACAASGSCVAVGSYEAGSGSDAVPTGLAETLSGGTWAPATVSDVTSTAGNVAALVGVSCPAAGSCVAVGDRTTAGNSDATPVGEILTGGAWTASTPALPADADRAKWASLNDVFCPASGSCVATGRYTDQAGASEGLLDTLSDGTWTAVKAPLPAGAAPGQASSAIVTLLTDVACTAVGTCVASGQYLDSAGAGQGVIETLSGGHWTAAKAALPTDAAASGQLAALWTIYCQAPGSCLAGGHYKSSGGQARYLTETLSGGTWTAASITLPANAAADQKWSQKEATAVDGLSCQQAGSCVAADSYLARGGAVDPAVSTLSGGTWQTASLPLPAGAAKAGKQEAYPTLVACPAAGSCVTVGAYNAADGSAQGLIETAVPKRG